MDIKPVDRTVKNVLEGGLYQIPRFQRPYSWDKENVDDFWTDVVTSEDPDYFIGAFVLYPERAHSDVHMIVDGQQRLTTITLLLAAIRNGLDSLEYDKLAAGIQKLIEREDIDSKLVYVLQSQTPYPVLQEHIQKRGAPALPKTAGVEQESLQLAFKLIEEKIQQTLSAVDGDPTIPADKKKTAKKDKLVAIRDKVLRLQLILVSLGNEDDAYLIFETLNTRGKNLGVGDLVKNHLTRLLRPTNKGVDVARDKWNGIRTQLDQSAADLSINRFIYHAWLSRYPYLGEKKLFREIKRTVTASNAMDFLDLLVADSKLYRVVFEPHFHKWQKDERKLFASLRALNLFRVVQPVPMLLAMLREHAQNGLTTKQIRSVLTSMENFHVQFTAVTAQRTGGGTARMYAASAEDLTNARDNNARQRVLREFVQKMRERIPPYEEFKANFEQIAFHSSATRQKPLVQYLLERFDAQERTGAPPDYSAMTIEHIAPENPPSRTTISAQCVGMLGNLILLPQPLNNKVGNKTFAVKKAAYARDGVPMDSILLEASKWGDDEIRKRTSYLAELGHQSVFAL